MGLREKIRTSAGIQRSLDFEKHLFEKYGITENPFPPSNRTYGNPHLETTVDDEITRYVSDYDRNKKSEVIVIEGDQGTGKTNLLNYYESEFKKLYPEQEGYYVIRYLADPELDFDKILTQILDVLGIDFLVRIGKKLIELEENERETKLEAIKKPDLCLVFRSLIGKPNQSNTEQRKTALAAKEWLLGQRLFNRHKERLGPIQFRLDTIESRTQVFRDLVYFSADLKVLSGIILLLDEIEKVDMMATTRGVLRFLSAIRALIDSLPDYLFMMLAITPEALRRYFGMVPAVQGRLQKKIPLPYLTEVDSAKKLTQFYIQEAQKKAKLSRGEQNSQNINTLLSDEEIERIFSDLLAKAKERSDESVRHRDFLNELHKTTNDKLNSNRN